MKRHSTPEDRALFAYAIRARAAYADRPRDDRADRYRPQTVADLLRQRMVAR